MNFSPWVALQHLGNQLKITKPRVRVSRKFRHRNTPPKHGPTITFLCPAINVPLGGIKVLYKNSEYLTSMGVKSFIFHPEISNFSCDWFKHSARIRSREPFDPREDFIVIPEVWACEFGKQCKEQNIKYAIYVQNGYLISSALDKIHSTNDLQSVYENAALVMSISDDTSMMIRLAFPQLDKRKIVRMLPHIGNHFSNGHKRRLITFMPRKLEEHSQKVCFYLKQNLPNDWQFSPIDGKSEMEVAELLSESSIFLSFCDQEGFGLPPLEAVLSGNIAIGYTGQGAKEYFERPLFRPVENGDFASFVEEVLIAISEIDSKSESAIALKNVTNGLRLRYSIESEQEHLRDFSKRVSVLFAFQN